jgi:hypothetical protein
MEMPEADTPPEAESEDPLAVELSAELAETLQKQLLWLLEGGQAKSDVELVSESAITRAIVQETMDKLVAQDLVQVVSSDKDPEMIYTISKRPKELRSGAFAELVRKAGLG